MLKNQTHHRIYFMVLDMKQNYKIPAEKPLEDICQSFERNEAGELVQCQRPGARRYDNGLDSGIHCETCWYDLVLEARQKSW